MKLKTRMMLVIGAVLVGVLCFTFMFVVNSQHEQAEELYYSQAKSISDCLGLVRGVISSHKGVWAKQTDTFGVNPYLEATIGDKAKMKNAKGEDFALINGFLFVQQMSEYSKNNPDHAVEFTYRAPSDKALNPVNNPTPAELKTLQDMRKKKEVTEEYFKSTDKNGKKTYTYNKGFITAESCIQPCHMDYKAGEIDGFMSVTLPIDKAEAMKEENTQKLMYIFLAITLLVVAVTYWLASRVTAPIKQLAEAADKISRGETDIDINITRKDEIGELAEAFNRMAASVKILMMTDAVEEDTVEEDAAEEVIVDEAS